MGLFGPPNIEKMKAKRDVDGLIKALGYQKDLLVRNKAAWALGELGDNRATEPLIAILKNKDSDMRQVTAEALGDLGDPLAVEPLIAALEGNDENVQRQAAKALGMLGDARAVNPLVGFLYHYSLRTYAVEALDNLKWQPDKDANGAAYWIIKQKFDQCVAIGAPAVEPLIRALLDIFIGNVPKCKAAAEALGKIGDARAIEPLIRAMNYSNEVVASATEALELIVRKVGLQAVEPLIAALGDENASVCKFAADSLRQIAAWPENTALCARAVEPLIEALKVKDGAARVAVAAALGEIRDARAVEPLIALLKDDRNFVREAAVKALGEMKDPRAVDPIIVAIQKGDSSLHNLAMVALEKIGSPAIERLIGLLGNPSIIIRKDAAQGLLNIYKSGQLNDDYKQNILSQRERIITEHSDRPHGDKHADIHYDYSQSGCAAWDRRADGSYPESSSEHSDSPHSDKGIGLNFPL